MTRIPSTPSVEPAPLATDHAVENGLGNLAMLIYRGPLLVNPGSTFEPSLVQPAIASAHGADHRVFVDRLADLMLNDSLAFESPWGALGATLFVEDYLDPSAVDAPGYDRLLVHGLTLLLQKGWLRAWPLWRCRSSDERAH